MLLDSASSGWKNVSSSPHPRTPVGQKLGTKLLVPFSQMEVRVGWPPVLFRQCGLSDSRLYTQGHAKGPAPTDFLLLICSVLLSGSERAPGQQCEQTWILLFPPPSPTKRAVE